MKSNVKLMVFSGSPEDVIAAGIGSIYIRTDVKYSSVVNFKDIGTGNTGWVAK